MLISVMALVAAACGGGDGGGLGTFGDGGATASGDDGSSFSDDDGSFDAADTDGSASSDGTGDEKFWLDPEDLSWDPAALPTDTVTIAALTDDGKTRPVPDDYPAPLFDSCAALDPAVVTQIANDFDTLNVPDFTATPFGPACRYRAQTHVIEVTVHDADTVRAMAENFLPIAAGEVSTNSGTLDGRVEVYSEDSFGVDTPYAWVLAEGDRGVIVRNAAGTGILIGAESVEEGWEAIAAAAFDGAAGLTAGDVQPDTPTQADPCSVFEPADIEAAFGITDVREEAAFGSCSWYPDLSSFSVEVIVGNPDADPFGANEEVGPNLLCCDFDRGGVVYHDPGVVSFSVLVWYPDGDGVSNRSNDVAIDLINTIVPRLN